MLTDSEFKPTFSISQKYHLSEWKSTLLRIFSRTIQYKTGVVRLNNKDSTLWNTKTLATRRALLHQESLLTIPFLVDDLVRLGRFPYPESKTNDVIIDICLKKVGMQHYKDRIYTSLSGGEKQRVNLVEFCNYRMFIYLHLIFISLSLFLTICPLNTN